MDIVMQDDTELIGWKFQCGSIVRYHRSLNEERIMCENAQIRLEQSNRDLSFGRMVLRMSEAQYQALAKRFPGLLKGDAREKTRLWKMIARDPEYWQLRVG